MVRSEERADMAQAGGNEWDAQSDNYLPPVDESFKPGVYEINLRRY